MGCHTGVYRNSYLTQREATQKAIEKVQKSLADLYKYKKENFSLYAKLQVFVKLKKDMNFYVSLDETYESIEYYELLLRLLQLSQYDKETEAYLGGLLYGEMLWDLQLESGEYITREEHDHKDQSEYDRIGHDGTYYVDVDDGEGYHDMFRVRNYPEKKLYSFLDFICWILNPVTWMKYHPLITWKGIQKVYVFFREYPDSLITFG